MHLLDSDTLRHLHEEHPRVIRRLRELPAGEVVATTIITRIEALRGRFDYLLKAATTEEFLRAQRLLTRTDELLRELPIVPLNEAALAHFERLRRVKGLKKVGRGDLLIGSITLAHRATLVSRNVRDFRKIPDLRVVNWID